MGLEEEYVEYAVELSLAIFAVVAAYFVNLGNPVSLAGLILVPVLYGYTSYISHEGFNYASLAGLPALFFVALGGVSAVAAVFCSLGNIMVSAFSYGEKSKDFYSSTSVPMLTMGLLIGASIYGYGTLNPDFKEEVRDNAGEKAGEAALKVLPSSQLVENQREKQIELVNSTAVSAVRLTSEEVMNDTGETAELKNAFKNAERPVQNKIYSQISQENINATERAKQATKQQIKNLNFILAIPILGGLFYSLQPLLGLLTAIFAKAFRLADRHI
jgi:hypothetical protein